VNNSLKFAVILQDRCNASTIERLQIKTAYIRSITVDNYDSDVARERISKALLTQAEDEGEKRNQAHRRGRYIKTVKGGACGLLVKV
jgi:hypothetical protein